MSSDLMEETSRQRAAADRTDRLSGIFHPARYVSQPSASDALQTAQRLLTWE